jgi:hypothetical protein
MIDPDVRKLEAWRRTLRTGELVRAADVPDDESSIDLQDLSLLVREQHARRVAEWEARLRVSHSPEDEAWLEKIVADSYVRPLEAKEYERLAGLVGNGPSAVELFHHRYPLWAVDVIGDEEQWLGTRN